jgi:hypothetical protein
LDGVRTASGEQINFFVVFLIKRKLSLEKFQQMNLWAYKLKIQ